MLEIPVAECHIKSKFRFSCQSRQIRRPEICGYRFIVLDQYKTVNRIPVHQAHGIFRQWILIAKECFYGKCRNSVLGMLDVIQNLFWIFRTVHIRMIVHLSFLPFTRFSIFEKSHRQYGRKQTRESGISPAKRKSPILGEKKAGE